MFDVQINVTLSNVCSLEVPQSFAERISTGCDAIHALEGSLCAVIHEVVEDLVDIKALFMEPGKRSLGDLTNVPLTELDGILSSRRLRTAAIYHALA
jgi:hypothetical protein